MRPATKTGACDPSRRSAHAPPQFVRRIVCDHRERPSGVPTALAKHPDTEVTIQHLPLGDYEINDLIVERKTLTDFARSVTDGRLLNQIARLARQRNKRVCLFIEGTTKDYPNLSIPPTAFRGALVTVAVVFCVPILRSATVPDTADLILYAARQLNRRNARPLRRFGTNPGDLTRQQRFMLQAIPGIGPVKAADLLHAFGSPAGIATATIEDLRIVEGIGESAAMKIYAAFHGAQT